MPDITEKNFESTIYNLLIRKQKPASRSQKSPQVAEPSPQYTLWDRMDFVPGGFTERTSADYDPELCLDPDMVISFLQATQPKQWGKLRKQYGDRVRERFLRRLVQQIERRGPLDVFRNGINDMGAKFNLVYFKPATSLNPDLQDKYKANHFSVIRQWQYSLKDRDKQHRKTIDLGLFLNGIPIFSAELKNPLTGQNYQNAIHQYKTARLPTGEPILQFGRCLAHFAVDPDQVHFTTGLHGDNTRFFPFNQGRGHRAGNPAPPPDRFATDYLWEEVWAKDSILDLLQNFIHILEERDERGRKTGEKALIFPRYHQLKSTRKMVTDASRHGPGKRYLVQHSAGSGKTFTISWLTHQLANLHNEEDQSIFDTIIVITDRKVLDLQLQDHVQQFERVKGLVAAIDKKSRQLQKALESGKQIIVTTLHKFSYIYESIGNIPGKQFAIVIDEAHSSQTGEMKKHMKTVLMPQDLTDAEDLDEVEHEDWEDRIVREMEARGRLPNVSTYAFTATPKGKTLELFGTQQADGSYEPFDLYSMRQAIEEGFILDVLEHYTTYQSYWRLLKKVKDDPRYEKKKAASLLRNAVEQKLEAVEQKTAVMVEDFHTRVARYINGRAKAMILTRSRLHAVRYRQVLDRYLKKRGYPYQALVAFSGTVKDPETGKKHTESNMNAGVPQTQTADHFHKPEYRFLVVANKFQTGFDEPLLTAMYVDKRLGGVRAVQSLSRLNRTHPGKTTTYVLDFANEAESIQAAFADYYGTTRLKEGTDPNLLYDLQHKLNASGFFTAGEEDQLAQTWYAARQEGTLDQRHPQIHNALQPAVERYEQAPDDEKLAFRDMLKKYARTYSFLGQLLPFVDPDLEKLYVFVRLLLKRLPAKGTGLPTEVVDQVELGAYNLKETHEGKIDIEPDGELKAQKGKGKRAQHQADLATLSTIVRLLNEQFGLNIAEDEGEDFLENLLEKLMNNESLAKSVEVNTPDDARLTFREVINDIMQDMLDVNFKMYKTYTEDQLFAETIRDWMYAKYSQEQDE